MLEGQAVLAEPAKSLADVADQFLVADEEYDVAPGVGVGERLLADLDRALEQLDDEILAPLTHSEREMLNVLLTRSALNAPTGTTRDVTADYRDPQQFHVSAMRRV